MAVNLANFSDDRALRFLAEYVADDIDFSIRNDVHGWTVLATYRSPWLLAPVRALCSCDVQRMAFTVDATGVIRDAMREAAAMISAHLGVL